ncbi:MAG: hypothetical protein D6714_15425 [Bacteroidetes bacterium]|nr:MAG: hypothetical protein D6714_15425 [Bacteroidota bacterium]
MPEVRYLKIQFGQNLFPYEVPKFRGAVIEKIQRVSDLFHNHQGDNKFIYRYPLVQYKVSNKKAGIVCLNDGTDDIHYLLQVPDLTLRIGAETRDFVIEDVDLRYHHVQVCQTELEYSILNWQALNQKSYARYRELEDDQSAQIDLLESNLRGHILAFAKGIGWWVEQPIYVRISSLKNIKLLPYKKQRILTFSLHFKTNVSLPDYIGLGKGASVGFGVLRRVKERG